MAEAAQTAKLKLERQRSLEPRSIRRVGSFLRVCIRQSCVPGSRFADTMASGQTGNVVCLTAHSNSKALVEVLQTLHDPCVLEFRHGQHGGTEETLARKAYPAI